MSQPASQRIDMRQQMPETADYIDQRRREWGADYVNDCIRRSLKGEPDCFYAIEGGHVLGTPFAMEATAEVAALILRWGTSFCCFLKRPREGQHGA